MQDIVNQVWSQMSFTVFLKYNVYELFSVCHHLNFFPHYKMTQYSRSGNKLVERVCRILEPNPMSLILILMTRLQIVLK